VRMKELHPDTFIFVVATNNPHKVIEITDNWEVWCEEQNLKFSFSSDKDELQAQRLKNFLLNEQTFVRYESNNTYCNKSHFNNTFTAKNLNSTNLSNKINNSHATPPSFPHPYISSNNSITQLLLKTLLLNLKLNYIKSYQLNFQNSFLTVHFTNLPIEVEEGDNISVNAVNKSIHATSKILQKLLSTSVKAKSTPSSFNKSSNTLNSPHILLSIIGEDTGLYLQAFQSFPGPKAKRIGDTDEERWRIVIEKCKSSNNFSAFFLTIAAATLISINAGWGIHLKSHPFIAQISPTILTTGRLMGEILTAPKGAGGFGYDPIFSPHRNEFKYIPEQLVNTHFSQNSKPSLAEIPHLKKFISHRSKAMRKIFDRIFLLKSE